MSERLGTLVSAAASVALVVGLLLPYAARPADAIDTYYGSGALNPLFAGALAVGVLLVLFATIRQTVSRPLGVGIALGLSVFAFLAAALWAVTARLDVFWAPGWAFPVQRWLLVAFASLAVLGAAWQVRSLGLLGGGR